MTITNNSLLTQRPKRRILWVSPMPVDRDDYSNCTRFRRLQPDRR